jgi:hypothetical protein
MPTPIPAPAPTGAAPTGAAPTAAPTAATSPRADLTPPIGPPAQTRIAPPPPPGQTGFGAPVAGHDPARWAALTRPRVLIAAAAAVVVVVAGLVFWLTRPGGVLISPANGGVSVRVPSDWTTRTGVAFPGATSPDDGVRATSGTRSIAVAYAGSANNAITVLTAAAPAGCTPGSARGVTVGSWPGTVAHYSGCQDGSSVDEVVLGGGSTTWTVWVEVRSVDSDPDLSSVLGSLDVSPR